MRRFIIISISLIILLVAVITLKYAFPSAPLFDNVITKEDLDSAAKTNNGIITKTLYVPKDGTFAIVLYVSPGAGMAWSSSCDSSYVVEERPRDYVKDNLPGTVGEFGRILWTFRSLKKGETAMVFTYFSSPSSQTLNVLELHLIIK